MVSCGSLPILISDTRADIDQTKTLYIFTFVRGAHERKLVHNHHSRFKIQEVMKIFSKDNKQKRDTLIICIPVFSFLITCDLGRGNVIRHNRDYLCWIIRQYKIQIRYADIIDNYLWKVFGYDLSLYILPAVKQIGLRQSCRLTHKDSFGPFN